MPFTSIIQLRTCRMPLLASTRLRPLYSQTTSFVLLDLSYNKWEFSPTFLQKDMSFMANPRANHPHPDLATREPTGAVASDPLTSESLPLGRAFGRGHGNAAAAINVDLTTHRRHRRWPKCCWI